MEARLLRDEAVEVVRLHRVAVEERDERGLRPRRPLAAEEAELVRAAGHLAVVEHEVLEPETGALADGRRLGRLEMREAEAGEVAVLPGEAREAADDAHDAARHEPEPFAHDDQVRVVADEGGRSPEVDDALGGGRDVGERVDVGHHVVLRVALVAVGGGELLVGRDEMGAERVEGGVGDREPELLLRLGEPEPELPPRRELRARREEAGHLVRRVARGQRVLVDVERVRHDFGILRREHSPRR